MSKVDEGHGAELKVYVVALEGLARFGCWRTVSSRGDVRKREDVRDFLSFAQPNLIIRMTSPRSIFS